MRKLFRRTLLMAIVLLAGASTAGARDKMTGVNGIRFGWKYDKCVEALGDPQRSVTTDPINEQRQYSYAPASWGTVAWDNGVLDFYKDKLMQVGFSRTTATPDMSAFEGARSHLTDLYGEPAKIRDTDNNLLWRAADGNIAILQYVAVSPSKGEARQASKKYTTLLYFIDNKEVAKKAKNAEGYLRSL
ncbi:hypothetical protein, partial [Muribaculum intestinale]